MFPEVHAGLDDANSLAFEKLFLEGSVRFADEDFAAFANDAVPRDASSRGSGGHGAASSACTARQAESLSEAPIG